MTLLFDKSGIVRFYVQLDTLQVISGMILWVRWANQQRHSTEGWQLVKQVKGQSNRLGSVRLAL